MATGRRTESGSCEILVRTALASDIGPLSRSLDELTKVEAAASTGLKPDDALFKAYSDAEEVWVAEVDDEVVCMGGVRNSGGIQASVWLVCSPLAGKAPIALIRMLRGKIKELSATYGMLHGFVDGRHEKRKRWLKVLGFEIAKTPVKIRGFPFFRFTHFPEV